MGEFYQVKNSEGEQQTVEQLSFDDLQPAEFAVGDVVQYTTYDGCTIEAKIAKIFDVDDGKWAILNCCSDINFDSLAVDLSLVKLISRNAGDAPLDKFIVGELVMFPYEGTFTGVQSDVFGIISDIGSSTATITADSIKVCTKFTVEIGKLHHAPQEPSEPKFAVDDVVIVDGKHIGRVEQILRNDLYEIVCRGYQTEYFFHAHVDRIVKGVSFTPDEKAILRNLNEDYKFIARDSNGYLWIYDSKPQKAEDKDSKFWITKPSGSFISSLTPQFKADLFKDIKWEDEEACEFRKYLEI